MKKTKIMIYIKNLEENDIKETLLNFLKQTKNEVDLYLENDSNIKEIPKKINIINLNLSNNCLNKIIILLKKIINILKYYQKYSYGIIFDNKSELGNTLIRYMCKNKTIYVINDTLINADKDEIRSYFTQNKIYDFNNILFLNNEEQEIFLKYYPSLAKKTHVINFLINCDSIQDKSKVKIKEKIKRTDVNLLLITELNEEKNKILSKIKLIEKISQEIPNLKMYIIGDGIDKTAYQSYIEDHKLETTIYLLNSKNNIYPYLKKCSYILTNAKTLNKLLIEAIYLNTEIITSENLSDDYFIIEKNFGHHLSRGKQKEQLLDILKNKRKNTKKINFQELNEKRTTKLESIIMKK